MVFDIHSYLGGDSRKIGFLSGIINILISCLEQGKEIIE